MKIKLFALLSCIIITACKNEKKETIQESTQTESLKVEKKLVFKMHIKTTEPDVFSLFANDVFLNNNQFMNISIKHKLNANETEKDLRFEFPENINPDYQMGISFGPNNVKDVVITNATLSFGDTEFKITQDNIMNYFITNQFVDFDSETKTFKTKRAKNRYNPLLFVRKRILDSLQNVN